MALTVFIRDAAFTPRGMLKVTAAQAVLRDNAPDTATLTVDPSQTRQVRARLKPGWGVILKDAGVYLSGTITKVSEEYQGEELLIQLNVLGDMHHLADRLTYPDPAHGAEHQARARYTRRAPAAELIRDLVRDNLGAGAIPSRRAPVDIELPPPSGSTPTVLVDTRFKNLLEVCQQIAQAGNVHIRARQTGTALEIAANPRRDLSRRVQLASSTGEIARFTRELAAPTATAIIAAGQGEGENRQMLERTRPAWERRIEDFKDRRDTDEPAKLDAAAQADLDKGAPGVKINFDLIETPTRQLGNTFDIGDIITLRLPGGTTYTDTLTQANIAWKALHRTVSLTLGKEDTPQTITRLRSLSERLDAVERI